MIPSKHGMLLTFYEPWEKQICRWKTNLLSNWKWRHTEIGLLLLWLNCQTDLDAVDCKLKLYIVVWGLWIDEECISLVVAFCLPPGFSSHLFNFSISALHSFYLSDRQPKRMSMNTNRRSWKKYATPLWLSSIRVLGAVCLAVCLAVCREDSQEEPPVEALHRVQPSKRWTNVSNVPDRNDGNVFFHFSVATRNSKLHYFYQQSWICHSKQMCQYKCAYEHSMTYLDKVIIKSY